MTRFVSDIKGKRWVVVAPARISRPADNLPSPPGPHDPSCPFCTGNEARNVEVFRISGGGPSTSSGQSLDSARDWKIRVINNKYPITPIHEVIVHSPDHEKDIEELDLPQVELVLSTYRQRYNYHVTSGHGTVLIFLNHDVHAGASIKHPHSQLAVVPKEINLEAIPREKVANVVGEGKYFVSFCPDFSQWPYELWLAPKAGGVGDGVVGKSFGEVTDEEIVELAGLLQKSLRFIVQKFQLAEAIKQGSATEVPYNYYIYHEADWYLRIIPRLIHRAGFELGSGISVNVVDPAAAAEEYKKGLQ